MLSHYRHPYVLIMYRTQIYFNAYFTILARSVIVQNGPLALETNHIFSKTTFLEKKKSLKMWGNLYYMFNLRSQYF